jgi:hypothetical protein
MGLYWSLLLLFLLFNKTVGNFINFKNGYEYTYHFTSDSTIKELDSFQTDAKVSPSEACQIQFYIGGKVLTAFYFPVN